MEFKTLEDQEAARLVLKDAHASGILGYGQFYRVRTDALNISDLSQPVCPVGHLEKAEIKYGGFNLVRFDNICEYNGMQAGFDYVMSQVDEADIG